MTPKPKVLLGMSGGVDSSVAAYLLLQAGYQVIGVTLKIWPQDCISRAQDKCCGPQAIADARAVAHTLGIPHYVIDETDTFTHTVIDYFTQEYRQGRTPIPCILCNEKLKFGKLRATAASLGAQFIATGHYARLDHHPHQNPILRRATDRHKDQSYFLFSLSHDQLRSIQFPIGHLHKDQVRTIAQQLHLRIHDKQDSQEICFVPGNDYKAFLQTHYHTHGLTPKHGAIYHCDGRYLGQHQGIEHYTIGQRKGLPGGQTSPLYVIDIDPTNNLIIVGPQSHLKRTSCTLERTNWLTVPPPPPHQPITIEAKLSHNAPTIQAQVIPLHSHHAQLIFNEPQTGIAPGQAAVFYQDDLVLGGGWVKREPPPQTNPSS
jgi:tRNA-specific 2-thiouridylase